MSHIQTKGVYSLTSINKHYTSAALHEQSSLIFHYLELGKLVRNLGASTVN